MVDGVFFLLPEPDREIIDDVNVVDQVYVYSLSINHEITFPDATPSKNTTDRSPAIDMRNMRLRTDGSSGFTVSSN